MKILFASKNKNKFEEIKEIFSDSDFEIIFDDSLEDVANDLNKKIYRLEIYSPPFDILPFG